MHAHPWSRVSQQVSPLFSGKPPPLLVEPPNVFGDLSSLRDPSNEYLVSVTAVGETESSESVPEEGLSFSYYKDAVDVDTICKFISVRVAFPIKPKHH